MRRSVVDPTQLALRSLLLLLLGGRLLVYVVDGAVYQCAIRELGRSSEPTVLMCMLPELVLAIDHVRLSKPVQVSIIPAVVMSSFFVALT